MATEERAKTLCADEGAIRGRPDLRTSQQGRMGHQQVERDEALYPTSTLEQVRIKSC